eukprot:CAMPEP_0196740178 /NCGR_PEP_ID=MMETSP1091-20130531/29657_1 /TAXON_ID=302021 /ORGANISM="Rhodomonas sp., Strain CCMP768" /LENGTH=54 /DNA_ID=CAMNT_0042085173 /DNA_START=155 /DNA_END=319 /DNA_ORIENTATION=+
MITLKEAGVRKVLGVTIVSASTLALFCGAELPPAYWSAFLGAGVSTAMTGFRNY